MNRRLLAVALAVAAGAVSGATPAFAQDWESGVKADVPFAFVIGSTTMPAGSYVIRRNSGVAANVYEIQNTAHRSAKGERLFEGEESVLPNRPATKGDELVFTKVGDTYFLSKVESGPTGSEILLTEPKSERRLLARGSTVRIDSTGTVIAAGD